MHVYTTLIEMLKKFMRLPLCFTSSTDISFSVNVPFLRVLSTSRLALQLSLKGADIAGSGNKNDGGGGLRKREAIELNDCGDRGAEAVTADACVDNNGRKKHFNRGEGGGGRGEEKKDLTVEEIRDARLKRFAAEG